MYPLNSPVDLREEYQARVDAAVRKGQLLDATRRAQHESAWTRLWAWLSAWRTTRVERRRAVDSNA